MVFSTGYQANLGLMSTIAGKEDYIILDADSHASIYDGCALGDAQIVRFRHNNVEDLDKRLGRLPAEAGKLVVLEGVYSMLGDIAPLKEMVAVAKAARRDGGGRRGARHGLLRRAMAAACSRKRASRTRSISSSAPSPRSVGTVGGFCVSNHPKFEVLRLVCRPYVFTASLPPSVVATAATSIRKLMHAGDKRAHLWKNSRRLHAGPARARLQPRHRPSRNRRSSPCSCPTSRPPSLMWQALLEAGLYVNMARPPATPAGMYPAALLALRRA